jgi:peptidoglycan/LPS O-acetylase OafA/YrhL
MKPLVILVVLPMLVGIAAEMHFRDTRRATLAAALGAALVVGVCVQVLDPSNHWNWLAAILVSPLPIAIAVVAALFLYGRARMRRRRHDSA